MTLSPSLLNDITRDYKKKAIQTELEVYDAIRVQSRKREYLVFNANISDRQALHAAMILTGIVPEEGFDYTHCGDCFALYEKLKKKPLPDPHFLIGNAPAVIEGTPRQQSPQESKRSEIALPIAMTGLDIKVLLLRRGKTIRQLADSIGEKRSAVSKVLHGRQHSPHIKQKIAAAVAELLTGETGYTRGVIESYCKGEVKLK